MSWLQEPFDFHYFQVSSVSLSLKTKTKKIYRHCFFFFFDLQSHSMKFDHWKLPKREVCGEGEMDNRGEGGHNRGEVKKVVVDNSQMVMYCQRTAKTCEGNENCKHLFFFPNKVLIVGLGRTGNLLLLKQRCYAPSLPIQPLPSQPHPLLILQEPWSLR